MITIFDRLQLPEKIQLFASWHLFRLVERIIFKINCPKRIFPSEFVKLGSNILCLFLAEKMVVYCLFVCLFVATLSDFGLLFFRLKHVLIELRKMLLRKKLFGNCLTRGTQILQIYWIYKDTIELTSKWKVRLRQTLI